MQISAAMPSACRVMVSASEAVMWWRAWNSQRAKWISRAKSRFNAVFVNNKSGRQFCYAVWGMVGVIWCLHYLSS